MKKWEKIIPTLLNDLEQNDFRGRRNHSGNNRMLHKNSSLNGTRGPTFQPVENTEGAENTVSIKYVSNSGYLYDSVVVLYIDMETNPTTENRENRKESPMKKSNAHIPQIYRRAPSPHLRVLANERNKHMAIMLILYFGLLLF